MNLVQLLKKKTLRLDRYTSKYAIAINGVTKLMMMKADVLSNLKIFKCVPDEKYNGELIDYLPFDASEDTIEPVYKELAAWKEDLTQLSSIDNAPSQLIDYIDFLEKELETPIVVVWLALIEPKL